MRRLPNFYLLRAFEAAARLESFSQAARELSVTPSAVSHQIKELEAYFECVLFERLNRRVELTTEGRQLRDRLAPVLDDLEEACHSIGKATRVQALAIHCAPSFAVKWLGPRLPEFLAAHPGITIRLSTGAERFDLLERTDVDAFIAYGDAPRQAGIAVEALGTERIVPLCSPALVSSPPNPLADLKRLTLIESQLSPVKWSDWFALNRIRFRPRPGLSFDRAALALSAAVDGMGVALESATLAEVELEDGRLIDLGGEAYLPFERTIHHLCYREVDRNRAGLKAFTGWLHRALNTRRAGSS